MGEIEGLSTLASGLLALSLVAVAVVLSLSQRLGLEKDLGIAVPATGLWRPRAQPVEVKPRRWYSSFQREGEKKPRPPSAKRSYWPLDQHNSKTD